MTSLSTPRFLLNGDTAVSAVFGDRISEEVNQTIRAFQLLLTARKVPGIVETVPTYCSLMIHYDPDRISCDRLLRTLKELAVSIDTAALPPSEVLEIPVLYGGEMGPDLAHVAENAGISEEEVVKRHSAPEYLIYMLGFTPGFTYLGGLDPSIETPRLKTPRVSIPAGSVGIAGKQTGIYPIASPGGWQLIGRTPVRMYDPLRETPILPRAGQYIHFFPITAEEFRTIEAEIEAGTYRLSIRKREEVKA
ncbi:5-oxoprolinase subunit PxpB [Stomatobaculum longum]|uniref:5-oxoprolinase subunit PxpB n=1 Tax=Stomatobaculum longum TaxID=796942 RepID=UPI0028DB4E5F|nr:5-oxoprolinase subunit PxpB [Stomatobaculum longum]